MSTWATKHELMAEEDRLWGELHSLVDLIPKEQVESPGYFEEGWSAKDLVGHIGCWLAEGGVVLERIRFGTYRPEEIDVDGTNQQCIEATRNVPFDIVRAQAFAARARMLSAWGALTEDDPEADVWIRKAGPEHYREHLPRLREWLAELSD
jgi:hypothetical protein